MYAVSDAYKKAIQDNTRSYYWTGKITLADGTEYPFENKDIVKGSGYVTRQCCGSNEIELGTVYAAELGITLLTDIDRYSLTGATITLSFHLDIGNGVYEEVPMGIFEISEANRTIRCLDIKAYDYMLRFDADFDEKVTNGVAYDLLLLACEAYKVELANTKEELAAMKDNAYSLDGIKANRYIDCVEVNFEGNYFISISMDTSGAILINKVRKCFCEIGLNFPLKELGDELLETHTLNPTVFINRYASSNYGYFDFHDGEDGYWYGFMDDQLVSLDTQKSHYEEYISANPDWEFAGLYYDEGITGTKKELRPALMQMIRDCEDGRIDYIITKSLSRFARNTTDCLELVRKLLALDIPIYFEKENLDTGEMESELLLSIMQM